jgi:hypothetical protein
VQLHLTIDLRAVILGFVLLLVATGIAAPFAISLADDGPARETPAAQSITLGTAFTYQGRLDSGSGPATGIYDLRFTLFDAETAGSAVAGPLSVNDVTVADGLFAATIDFGANAFPGSARWLSVEAKANASPTFDVLAPRQPLSPVPYALFAISGGTQYTAGTGLTLAGAEFSVQFLAAGPVNGNAATSARSDHTHVNQSWTGSREANSSGGSGILNIVNAFPGTAGSYGFGIKGEAQTVGVFGQLPQHGPLPGVDMNSFFGGVVGYDRSFPCDGLCVGVSGFANSGPGNSIGVHGGAGTTGVLGTTFSNGTGVKGQGSSGIGVWGQATSGSGVFGEAVSGHGLYGVAQSGIGVRGFSLNNNAIYGESQGAGAALRVYNTGAGQAIYGEATTSDTVVALRNTGNGDLIRGYNNSFAEVFRVASTGATKTGILSIDDPSGLGASNSLYMRNGGVPILYVKGSGALYSASTLNANALDLAEHVSTSGVEPGPGDVVEIDPDVDDRFRLSSSANSALVAGVISTNPGMVLGTGSIENPSTSPRLALAGRVPVKVSAENGPIRPGDLLVSSSTPGHAMKAPTNPAAGTVIGKALGSLDSGKGTVPMLVMLR